MTQSGTGTKRSKISSMVELRFKNGTKQAQLRFDKVQFWWFKNDQDVKLEKWFKKISMVTYHFIMRIRKSLTILLPFNIYRRFTRDYKSVFERQHYTFIYKKYSYNKITCPSTNRFIGTWRSNYRRQKFLISQRQLKIFFRNFESSKQNSDLLI